MNTMTKYIRSRTRLTKLINEVFAVSSISLDTKLIVLFLAATLSRSRFNSWIDNISQLDAFNSHFKKINSLRHSHGDLIRDYILITVFCYAKNDINSEELQYFIRSGADDVNNTDLVMPKIDLDTLCNQQDKEFIKTKNLAIRALLDHVDKGSIANTTKLIDIFLECRSHATPKIAAQALMHAIDDILVSRNIEPTNARGTSRKLVAHALKNMHQPIPALMLHKFYQKPPARGAEKYF